MSKLFVATVTTGQFLYGLIVIVSWGNASRFERLKKEAAQKIIPLKKAVQDAENSAKLEAEENGYLHEEDDSIRDIKQQIDDHDTAVAIFNGNFLPSNYRQFFIAFAISLLIYLYGNHAWQGALWFAIVGTAISTGTTRTVLTVLSKFRDR